MWSTTTGIAGSIDNYTQASTGANIAGSKPGGYSPLTFTPTVAGSYYIEIYRSNDGGVTMDSSANGRAAGVYFDFTVADNSGAHAEHTGRVHNDLWGFYAVDPTTFGNIAQASSSADVYSYTSDKVVIKVNIQAGFEPIAFNVSLNSYGCNNGGNFSIDRKSINAAVSPSLANGYPVFLNVPDAALYPLGTIPGVPVFNKPAITGCGPYSINFNINEPGDVKILLDLNGTAGFQAGTSDRIIEAFGLSAGNNSVTWDGLNGLGVAVPSGTNFNIQATFLKGRFNFPIYDDEMNKNGFDISTVTPVSVAHTQLFWDDSSMANIGAICDSSNGQNNLTGAGLNNSLVGTISPGHAWNGDGNISQTIPAAAIGGNDTDSIQCNDFGNARLINTWGWGVATTSGNLNIVLGCPDLQVTKVASSSTPTIGTNVTFTITAHNNGATAATGVVVADALPSGYALVSATPSSGTWADPNWTIGNMANGASATLTVVATVLASGSYGNTASISGDETDSVLGNNSSTSTPTPNNPPTANDDTNSSIPSTAGATPINALTATDTDGTISSYTVSTLPSHGTLYVGGVAVTAGQVLTPAQVATLTYDPDGTFTGNDTFTFTATDNLGAVDSTPATINLPIASIDAVNDTPAVVNGTTGASLPTVFGNDTLDGVAFIPSAVTLSTGALPSGLTIDLSTGIITVAPGTPSGTYPVSYTICQVANPSVCDTATVQVFVFSPMPDVNSGTIGTTIPGSVATNDTVPTGTTYGTPVASGTNPNATLPVINPNGSYTFSPTLPGVYTFNVPVCVPSGPTPCPTEPLVITVVSPLLSNNPPVATNDTSETPLNTPVTIAVTSNDGAGNTGGTLNAPTLPSTTSTHGGTLSVDPSGNVVYTPATGFTGIDTFTYNVCETPSGLCTSATVQVMVLPLGAANTTLASDDYDTTVNGATATGNVATNDHDPEGNTQSVTPQTNVVLPQGTFNLLSNGAYTFVPAVGFVGTVAIPYTTCDNGIPVACSTATLYIVVVHNTILANDDDYTPTPVADGQSTASVILNDTLNGNPVVIGTNPGQVTLTPTTVPIGLTLNADGTITVSPNTPSGTYTVTYQICENGANPANCDPATVIVHNTILANDDDYTPTPVADGQSTASVILNDTLNGNPVVIGTNPGQVTLTPTTVPIGLTLNADGTITVSPNTPSGTYTVTYQICENGVIPTNCSSANVLVVVQEHPKLGLIKIANFNDENGDGFAQAGETVTYTFSVTNTGDVPLTNINITDPLPGIVMSGGPISLSQGESDYTTFTANYIITQDDINNGSIINQAQVFGTSPGGIIISDYSDNSSILDGQDNSTVLDLVGCVIKVYNGITPDGDNMNDVFFIQGLDCYPENSVEIYNRWGVLVFERDGYNNTDRAFRGTSEGRVTIEGSKDLPAGTYFYVLKYKKPDGSQVDKAGYLYLNR